MKYSQEFLNKIVQFGTLGYPIEKIINIIEVDNINYFIISFNDINSHIYKSYLKGLHKADFIVDSKLFEMAKNGDLKALKMYKIQKKKQIYNKEN